MKFPEMILLTLIGAILFVIDPTVIFSVVFGGKIIRLIQRKQIGEQIRTLGLSGEEAKKELQLWEGLLSFRQF